MLPYTCAYYGVNRDYCDYYTNVVNLNLAEIIILGQSGLLSALIIQLC